MSDRPTAHINKLYSLAFALAVFTIIYNIIEGLIAVYIGIKDESLTLFGFGIDSFIETISGLGIAHMVLRVKKHAGADRSNFEKTALKVTGWSFYLLSGGLLLTVIYNLYTGQKPEATLWGVVISCISIVVMLVLIYYKIKVGRALGSESIIADANCTKVCIYMSLILLASTGIYKLTGFAYCDAIGALGIIFFSVQEGRECFEKVKNNTHCGCDHH